MARGCEVKKNEVLICLEDFNEHIGKKVEGVHGGFGIDKRSVEGRLLWDFVLKSACVLVIVSLRRRIIEIYFNGGCSETEKDFVLMKGSQRKFLKNVRAIRGELQHKLLKVILDGRWIRKTQQSHAVKVSCQKVWKLLNDKVKKKFSEKMQVLDKKKGLTKCMVKT